MERANRQYRKMQKSSYRVRTQAHIAERIALDLLRDARAPSRSRTLQLLHDARAGEGVPKVG